MVRIGFIACVLLPLAWGFSGAKPKISSPGTVRVYFAGNREGEVGPCGCQVHQLGGLDRLVSYFAAEKPETEATVFVESGDSFFSLPQMEPGRLEREKLKARLMAGIFKRLSLDAFCPGERDFAGGLAFLKELEKASGAVFLAANLTTLDGKHPFAASRLVERAGLKIGLVGVVGAEAFQGVTSVRIAGPAEVLRTEISELRAKGAQAIIVLSHQGLEADRTTAGLEGVDLIVGAHSLDALAEPIRVANTAIVQTQNQGQQIGRIRLKLPERQWLDHKVTDLDVDTVSDEAVLKAIADNKEAIRQMGLKQSVHSAPTLDGRPYVANSAYCKNCHSKQYDFWAGTKHSSAILVLFAKNQHFDPECISCHALGFEQPGGFSSIAHPFVLAPTQKKQKGALVETLLKGVFAADVGKGPLDSRTDPQRHAKLHLAYWKSIRQLEQAGTLKQNFLGVQCEHCHGNRNGHPGEGVATLKKVNEVSCKGCHTPPHAEPYDSRKFDRVACPLSSRG